MVTVLCSSASIRFFGLLLVLTILGPDAAVGDRPAKQYILNLDLPEEVRWNHILDEKPGLVRDIFTILKKYVPEEVLPIIWKLASRLNEFMPEKYAREISGIAKHLNVSVGEVLIPNILYEMTAFCTSIISTDAKGQIWHSRNLDYGFDSQYSDILKNLTFTFHAQKKGKTIYTATSYLSYVGVMTGQKPNAFTITIDQRDKGAIWMNILMAIFDKSATLIGFLERDILEEADTFGQAVDRLSRAHTIAPVYFIVGGVYPNEGAVVSKAHLGSADVWFLDLLQNRWFLVETNYDHWQPPPKSDDRRDPAIRMLNVTGQAGINQDSLFKIMSTPPVLNKKTTYTVIMSAAVPQIYHATIRTQP